MLPDRRVRFSLYGRTGSSLEDDNRGKTTTVRRVGIVVPTDGVNTDGNRGPSKAYAFDVQRRNPRPGAQARGS